MNPLWDYGWPLLVAGLVIGVLAATIGFRRGRWKPAIVAGFVAAIGAAALWHGPLGAADRFAGRVDRMAQESLDYYEMKAVTARLHRGPLTRRLVLIGPADDFQRGELVRLFSQVPGVSGASWDNRPGGLPLIAEGALVAILGFLIGAGLAYLMELRRRYNAQWNW
jgi:hypothetical protein